MGLLLPHLGATELMGRADPHIHSLASDGVSTVAEILDAAVAANLDVIAITDHERIDAAVAAQKMAVARGLPLEVIVGEEISTRSGHLVGLFMNERIRPWLSLRTSVARIHEQGGLAIIARGGHPRPARCRGPDLPPRRHRGVQSDHGGHALDALAARLPR